MKSRYESCRLERAARLLDSHADYQVIRRVPAPFPRMEGNRPPDDTMCVALVDVETTSLDPASGEIIELAIELVWVSQEGEVEAQLGPWSWLNDPGEPLTPEICTITGLCDDDLRGQAIDDRKVRALLARADWLCAHNARFDVQWIDRRYPEFTDKPWACSCSEIEWAELGFEGRSQSFLLAQHGLFGRAHRAGDDVWSLLQLLQQRRPDPDTGQVRSHFARLMEHAAQPSVKLSASGAPYAAKDELKARGYRWDARERVWSKLFDLADIAQEEAWFRIKALPQPTTRTVTAVERHR